jgi:hypothetical protein
MYHKNSSQIRGKAMKFRVLLFTIMSTYLAACTSTTNVSQVSCQPSLVNNQDGTITDTATNLMWTAGDYFRENISTGKGWINWESAMTTAKENNLKGYTDWRMPTKSELLSIVNDNCKSQGTTLVDKFPMQMSPLFLNPTYPYFWTSTENGENAIIVNFKTGTSEEVKKTAGNTVRFVRNIN